MKNGIARSARHREWRRAVWGTPARLIALLWLFGAVLAMPLVASAQIVASGTGALLRGGDLSGKDGRAGETALSRQTIRAAQPADLRFTAERVDSKPLPGGPDPLFLPVVSSPVFERLQANRASVDGDRRLHAGVCEAARARAPPRA